MDQKQSILIGRKDKNMADKHLGKYGVSELTFAKIKDDLIDGEKTVVPGTTEIQQEITIENSTLPADDGPYLAVSSGISEAKLTINNYDINSEAKSILYDVKAVKGIEIYGKNLIPNDVAVSYKTKTTTGENVYVGMLKGKFTLPGLHSQTAGDGAPEPETDEIEGTFVSRALGTNGDTVYLIGRGDDPDFDLETFMKLVFPKTEEDLTIPTETPAG